MFAVWVAVAAETAISLVESQLPSLGEVARVEVLVMVLPLVIVAGNWTARDESANTVGEQFAVDVFAELPPDAVLLTYWDALTNLSYAHCVDGLRPDVSLRAYDIAARVTCDMVTGTLQEVALERPVYALFAFDSELGPLRNSFDLLAGPRLPLPYGDRDLDHEGTLFQLLPKTGG